MNRVGKQLELNQSKQGNGEQPLVGTERWTFLENKTVRSTIWLNISILLKSRYRIIVSKIQFV